MLARIDRFLFFSASILGALAGIAGAFYARRGTCRVLPRPIARLCLRPRRFTRCRNRQVADAR